MTLILRSLLAWAAMLAVAGFMPALSAAQAVLWTPAAVLGLTLVQIVFLEAAERLRDPP